MSSSFFKSFYYIIGLLVVLIIFIPCFFTPFISNEEMVKQMQDKEIFISEKGFAWPIPGYTKITSDFGRRISPTAGATSFHKGIDIGAPEGTILIAVIEGTITYTGFLGGGGYTVTLSNNNIKISYCHVSPIFIVEVGQEVKQCQPIARVGPKYVYNVLENTYKDEKGQPTNGAITGTHLHLGIRVNNKYQNPLNYY